MKSNKDLREDLDFANKFFRNKNFPMLINITVRKADHSMSDSFSLRTISSFI